VARRTTPPVNSVQIRTGVLQHRNDARTGAVRGNVKNTGFLSPRLIEFERQLRCNVGMAASRDAVAAS
jgi:hypothetical protein